MTQQELKCDYESCEDEPTNHATYEQSFPDGYVLTTRTYHSNFCLAHLRKKENEFPFIKVFELGECDDEDCNLGKLPRINHIQE